MSLFLLVCSSLSKSPFTLIDHFLPVPVSSLLLSIFLANACVFHRMHSLMSFWLKSLLKHGLMKKMIFFLISGCCAVGWGTFHLGFAGGKIDPEPGRCRRTDGKKWRCSKDAVPDQKYCERHINRGRHRSRKPVEVQPGQTAASKAAASRNTASQSPNNRYIFIFSILLHVVS